MNSKDEATMTVRDNAARILNEMPTNVSLLAAAKMRNPGEILEAIEAGVRIVGENYVQEAERAFQEIGNRVEWHFIGHLQKNKVKKAVSIFDMIETVDSVELAQEIDKRCEQAGKTMPVLIEINSGREAQKSGVSPEDAERLINEIAKLERVRIKGLMTMGPLYGNPEESRPYFRETKKIFDRIKELNLPNVEMRYLSMGMTNSYHVALEEGANLVRIGSKIFGNRVCNNDITT
jgi:pyridoxal phosphate enzyme (YggS family)